MYSSRPSTFCTPDCIAHCSSEGMFRGANSAVAMADNFVVAYLVLVLEKREFGAKASTADLDRRIIDAAVALMVDEQLRNVSLRLDYACNVVAMAIEEYLAKD